MGNLLIVSGPEEGKYYPLGRRTTVVGRSEQVPLQLVDNLVSRKHFQIRYDPDRDRYLLTDLKSANGTRVNGREVLVEIELRDEDEILAGETKLVFSTREWTDGESALNAYKQRGHRMRPTINQ